MEGLARVQGQPANMAAGGLYGKPGVQGETSIAMELEALKKEYQDVTFYLPKDRADSSDLKDLAAGLGKGLHLVISREFLDRMQSSHEEYNTCWEILKKEAARLSGLKGKGTAAGVYLGKDKAAAWNIPAKDQASLKDQAAVPQFFAKADKAAGKKLFTSSASYSVSGHYNKMAAARTDSEVRKVMGDIQQNMARLRMAASFGDEEQQVKARRAVRSLDKLLRRGSRKIRHLKRERMKQYQIKKAQKQKEEQESRELEQELKRMRRAGKGRDNALVHEGMADDASIRSYRRYRLAHEAYGQTVLAGDMPELSAQAMPVMPGQEISPGDVMISSEYSF